MKRRFFLSIAGAGAAAALTSMPAFAETTKITLQLPWLMNSGFAGEILAVEKGYFAEHGLEVELLPGGPGTNPVQELLGGTADIVIGYGPQIMYAANRQLPLISFGAAFQQAPLEFFSLGEKGIESVADWKGMRVGASQDAEPQVKAMLAHAGLSFDDITFVQAQVPGLLQDQVDLVAAWGTNVSQIAPIVAHPGGYNAQSVWDNGLKLQSNYYITRKDTMADRKDMLVAFMEAVDEGWAFAADHPEEATDILVSVVPALDHDNELATLKVITAQYIYTPATQEHGFGHVSSQNWEDMLATYAGLSEISDSIEVSDLFDPSILDAAERTHR